MIEDDQSGQIKLCSNYESFFQRLISERQINQERILRILKCLSDFSLDMIQIKFLEFLIDQILNHGNLMPMLEGLTRYWVHTIRDEKTRKKMIKRIEKLLIRGPSRMPSNLGSRENEVKF